MSDTPDENPNSSPQMLQPIKKADRLLLPSSLPTRRAKTREVMNRFLREYENTAGNISASCRRTGITRRSFYRWSDPKSTLPIHVSFQKRLARIRPLDRILDEAELTVSQKISSGDLVAAMFVINKLGHRRGWTERPEQLAAAKQAVSEASVAAVKSYQMWLSDNPNASEAEKAKWLSRIAYYAAVPEAELIRTMKVQELTAGIQ
jgi:hypothetical protein